MITIITAILTALAAFFGGLGLGLWIRGMSPQAVLACGAVLGLISAALVWYLGSGADCAMRYEVAADLWYCR